MWCWPVQANTPEEFAGAHNHPPPQRCTHGLGPIIMGFIMPGRIMPGGKPPGRPPIGPPMGPLPGMGPPPKPGADEAATTAGLPESCSSNIK